MFKMIFILKLSALNFFRLNWFLLSCKIHNFFMLQNNEYPFYIRLSIEFLWTRELI